MSCSRNGNNQCATQFVKILVALVLGSTQAAVSQRKVADPAPPQPYDSVPRGMVHHHVYTTGIGINLPNDREDYYVYTPPGYKPASPKKYPVLYLLHGDLQRASSWNTSGDVGLMLDGMIHQGKARPMVVVMPLGYGNYKFFRGGVKMWLFPTLINQNSDLFSRMLLNEIVPQVEATYNVSKQRQDRAIAGLSMGGLEAVTVGLDNPKKFAWVGAFSAAVQMVRTDRFASITPKSTNFRLLWIACGEADHFVFKGNMRLIANLNQEGIPVTTIVTHGVHAWPVWRSDFQQFAPLLFQPK